MNILLTGANGFLGRSIKERLLRKHTIFELSRSSRDYKVFLEHEIPVFRENFEIVIHAAGKAHSIPKSTLEKKEFNDINVVGTINLLKGLKNNVLPKQFVFISSVSVYGQEKGNNINENHPLNARDPYGVSKIEAEKIILEWCKINGVICTVLRLPLLVGKNPPGNLGAMIKAIEKGYYFNIDGGKARKSMVLVDDVAAFIPKVAAIGGIYNLTDRVHPDFKQLSITISKQKQKKKPLNLPLFIAKLMGYAGDILGNNAPINSRKIKKVIFDLTFDDSKAREVAGWRSQRVLEYLGRNEI